MGDVKMSKQNRASPPTMIAVARVAASVSGQVGEHPIGPKYCATRAGGVAVLKFPLELVPLPLFQYNSVPDAFRDYLSVSWLLSSNGTHPKSLLAPLCLPRSVCACHNLCHG